MRRLLAGLFATAVLSVPAAKGSADDWKLDFGGRFMFDSLLASTAPEEDQTDFEVRRARLKIQAQRDERWKFTGSVDFPEGDFELRDLRLTHKSGNWRLEIGRMQEPIGMSAQSSSKFLPLMERPMATALGPGYGLGASVTLARGTWSWTLGGYSAVANEFDLANDSDDDAFDARISWAPVSNEKTTVHLGASYSMRWLNQDTLRFSLRPETVLVDDLNINHPPILDSDRYALYGLEAAWQSGSLLLQSEYLVTRVNRGQNPNPRFHGYYIQLSWLVTGERRKYLPARGLFASVRPNATWPGSGTGALELAARYGEADLRDTGVAGDQGRIYALGVNWYPNDSLRGTLNILRIEESQTNRTERENVLQARLQVHF